MESEGENSPWQIKGRANSSDLPAGKWGTIILITLAAPLEHQLQLCFTFHEFEQLDNL